MKVKWYSKGKFTEEEIEDEPYFGPRLKVLKYKFLDNWSFNGHSYWLIDIENEKLLYSINVDASISFKKYVVDNNNSTITQEEFESIKDGTIKISNNNGGDTARFIKWSDVIQNFPEDSIYI